MNVSIKMGITVDDELRIPCKFDEIIPAIVDNKESNQIYITRLNNLYGFANVNRGYTTKNTYTDISNFEDGLAIVSQPSLTKIAYGIINIDLFQCLGCIYDEIERISKKLFLVRKDNKYGVYKAGKDHLYIPCEFDRISYKIDADKESIILDKFTENNKE